jgi:hypothetical protein
MAVVERVDTVRSRQQTSANTDNAIACALRHSVHIFGYLPDEGLRFFTLQLNHQIQFFKKQ